MATVTTLPAVERPALLQRVSWRPLADVAGGAALAFALLGYHPYAEDGGIYAAALAARMDAGLFPAEHAFAVAHTGHGLFVPLLAAVAALLHSTMALTLLPAYVVCLLATIAAARSLACVLFSSRRSQAWAVVATAVTLGLPVAGTSLYLFDPYLTARSFSTPLLLWALSMLLRRRPAPAVGCFLFAFAFHPMMAAASGLLFASWLALRSLRRALWVALLVGGTLAGMALLRFVPGPDADAVRAASMTRAYWFASQWAWYECIGLLAPMLLLPVLARRGRVVNGLTPAARDLALAAAVATAIASVGTLLLVHPGNASMLLARMQPLRLLHIVYLVLMLLLGGLAAGARLRGFHAGWLACAVGAVSLFSMQRSLYPDSAHVELPWRTPSNGYEQAFLWVREHTPSGALFALDAGYTAAPGEDAQLFRAIALRSSLPDAAKDGGIASVMPQLATEWQAAAAAQSGLAAADDEERVARVRTLGATWTVLPASASTRFACPYANAAAKVCRLP